MYLNKQTISVQGFNPLGPKALTHFIPAHIFLHKHFLVSEMLKRSRGRYTDEQVMRCAKMSGAFGKEVDRLFSTAGLVEAVGTAHKTERSRKYISDISKFVKEYRKDALHDYLGGRCHQKFSNFKISNNIVNPRAMARQIVNLCKERDLWRLITEREMIGND